MESWLLALLVKPLVAVVLLLFLYWCKSMFDKHFPAGRIKALLLTPVFKSKQTTGR